MDTYAFGVVLLELITGKEVVFKQDGEEILLSEAVISIMDRGNAEAQLVRVRRRKLSFGSINVLVGLKDLFRVDGCLSCDTISKDVSISLCSLFLLIFSPVFTFFFELGDKRGVQFLIDGDGRKC
uniref:Putative Serine-threonine protein kinase, plant-type n=1 Tax=Davidia involucrata TaxID=16924 RepID=A0A5B6ZCN2_DAVIN